MVKTIATIAFTAFHTAGLEAQQRLKIDHATGREIANDSMRAMRTDNASIDHRKGIIYVEDPEHPVAAMAFSLEDGRLIRVYGGKVGDGPGEMRLRYGFFMAATDIGILLASGDRVLHFDSAGKLAWDWRPKAARVEGVCVIAGSPVVQQWEGRSLALRRRADGSSAAFGQHRWRDHRAFGSEEKWNFFGPDITCVGDVLYVLDQNEGIFGYAGDGRTFRVPLPGALVAAGERRHSPLVGEGGGGRRQWHRPRYERIFHNGDGDLIVLARYRRFVGAVIDPETGCYALIEEDEWKKSRVVAGVFRGNAVVFQKATEKRLVDGRTATVIYPGAHTMALRPLKLMGGEPCPADPEKSFSSKAAGLGPNK